MQASDQVGQDDLVSGVLDADERVIWQGEPDRQATSVRTRPLKYLGVLMLAGSIFAGLILCWSSATSGAETGEIQKTDLYMSIFGLVYLAAIGIILYFLGPFLLTMRFSGQRYILTNKRLWTLGPGRDKSAWFLDAVSGIAIEPGDARSGIGRIIIGGGNGRTGFGIPTQTIWHCVPDAENVFRLIQQAREQAISSRGNTGQQQP